jgi:hypothetical protein
MCALPPGRSRRARARDPRCPLQSSSAWSPPWVGAWNGAGSTPLDAPGQSGVGGRAGRQLAWREVLPACSLLEQRHGLPLLTAYAGGGRGGGIQGALYHICHAGSTAGAQEQQAGRLGGCATGQGGKDKVMVGQD